MQAEAALVTGLHDGTPYAPLYQHKNENERKAETGELFVSSIQVDSATMLKRMRPAPQGRGYRVRKRSNHVTLFVDTRSTNDSQN